MSGFIEYKGYKIKSSLKYTPTHEWIKINGKEGIVGISDYAQKKLRDIVYVEEPEIGREVKKGEEITVVESVKAVGEVYAPISGKIIKWNEKLNDTPDLITEDPYGEGWIVVLEIKDPKELNDLLPPEKYIDIIKNQEH